MHRDPEMHLLADKRMSERILLALLILGDDDLPSLLVQEDCAGAGYLEALRIHLLEIYKREDEAIREEGTEFLP